MKCSECGEEHDLLDPTFRRPNAVVAMAAEERAARVKESDDLCVIRGEPIRWFVRCVLPVALLDSDGVSRWGLWAEVSEADFVRIGELWSSPDQADEPAMDARIANVIPGYPDTLDLPVSLHLTGPTSRPSLSFAADSIHPFALECRAGVTVHRVTQWLTRR